MKYRPFDEIFRKKLVGDGDPWKLLAHTWWISDERSNFATKWAHPWVCLDRRHPSGLRIYRACPRSSKRPRNYSKWAIPTPANVLIGLDREGYILINCDWTFFEETIDSGEHIGDMPDDIKERIRELHQEWRQQRPTKRRV